MNPESENFDQLRRLLALKRHETPPPGYFNRFSNQVIARIEAGETGKEGSSFFAFLSENGWIHRFWAALDARPALAGAAGVAICGAVAVGLMLTETGDTIPMGLAASQGLGGELASQTTAPRVDSPLVGSPVPVEFPSTMGFGSLSSAGSIFDSLQPPRVTLTSFPAGN